MLRTVREYLNNGFRDVQGWCTPHLWQCIQPLHELQAKVGVDLPVAEIGIYHGKFLIGLLKTKNAPSGNFAIDVFDMQQFNLDGSGKGNLDAFLANLDANAVRRDAVEILRADSMSLSDREIDKIHERVGAFSLFSVDGCHLVEHTVNDIRIAMRLTAPEGVIFVDDYYNEDWPGVQEGVAKLYYTDCPRFVPLLFTCNKLFLCHISFHKQFLAYVAAHLKAHFPATKTKRVMRFGYDTLTVIPDVRSSDYLVGYRSPD